MHIKDMIDAIYGNKGEADKLICNLIFEIAVADDLDKKDLVAKLRVIQQAVSDIVKPMNGE